MLDTIDALAEERDQDEKIWGSMVKQTLKRRNPGFNESYYGFRTFSDLLEEAQTRKLLIARARPEVRRLHHPARHARVDRAWSRADGVHARSAISGR